ncbi:MAG: lysine transporter LysE [Oleiphilus sp.]|nr:MAG: lysine transporter LysE [Oleiphilus sp.]
MELITALLLFAFVASATPGPNNLMLMASAANFGIRRTLPHMMGVCIGVIMLIPLVGTGLMQAFDQITWSYDLLKILSILYMGYLAIKLVRTQTEDLNHDSQGQPLGFFQAVLFQWVNPKVWSMALAAITLFSPQRNFDNILLITTAFALVNLPSIGIWVLLGQQVRIYLKSAARLQAFNLAMVILLLGSLYPMLDIRGGAWF